MDAVSLFTLLCESGPFRNTTPSDLRCLLKYLFTKNLIDQEPEGFLILGLEGEKVAARPDFYAAFWTRSELSVRYDGRVIGQVSPSREIKTGEALVLNGQRWQIHRVSWKTRVIEVAPTEVNKAPVFLGNGGSLHTEIFKEMQVVLSQGGDSGWMEGGAVSFLNDARELAKSSGLYTSDVLVGETGIQWFPWVGTKAQAAIALWAKQQGIEHSWNRLSFYFPNLTRSAFQTHLKSLASGHIDSMSLAEAFFPKENQKFDRYVPLLMLNKSIALDYLDMAPAYYAASGALAQLTQSA